MKTKTLHQTLEDRENPDHVESRGPFPCNWRNAWLGNGFYFWDTFIENAHWWGEMRYKDRYIICKAQCDYDDTLCLDLVGDTEHMLYFHEIINYLQEQRKIHDKTTFAFIINLIRAKIPQFKYQAIRVYGINSISQMDKKYSFRLLFEVSKPQYIDFKPAIQICIFKSDGLNLRSYKIVYPEEYVQDYVI